MFRFLSGTIKIFTLILLLAALSVAVLYAIYGEKVQNEIRSSLEAEMGKMADGKVVIDSVGYYPPFSFGMNGIEITPNDPRDEKSDIDRLILTIDPFTLVKDKRLTSVIGIQRFRKGDIIWSAEIKTTSRPAADYISIMDPFLLESVSVLNAELKIGHLKLKDILGTLDIKNGKVSGGKMDFGYDNKHYFLIFKADDEGAKRYNVSFRTNNLSVTCKIAKKPGKVIIETLKGMFYIMKFNLYGEILNPTSSKSELTLDGTVQTSLEGISSLPEGLGKFGREHRLSGVIRSTVNLRAPEPDINLLDIEGNLFADKLKFDQMKVEEINTKWTVKNGRFSAPAVNAKAYGGHLSGRLTVDIEENYLPYRSELKLTSLDFGDFIYDATKKKVSVYGTMEADLSVCGLAMKPDSIDGFGSMRIHDAGLGPMPIVTPLLGNIYVSLENYFPNKYKININSFSMDFLVKDRRIESENINLGSKVAAINAEGYMDFDGKIDFSLQNELRDPPGDEFSGWQISLRRAITELGRNLGKAHVHGTLNEPEWDFDFASPDAPSR
jgi:hypothetical protein